MSQEVVSVPAEKLTLPAPFGELIGTLAFPVEEGKAYLVFYDPERLDPTQFYDAMVAGAVEVPCQLLFVPLLPGQSGPAVAMGTFESVAEWVEQVKEAAREA
jgi:hypothetical protein